MKKVLLCMLAVGLMLPVIAQNRGQLTKHDVAQKVADRGDNVNMAVSPVNRSIVEVPTDGWQYSGVSNPYDRQAQGMSYPMVKAYPDGFVASLWTNEEAEAFPGSINPNRGVAYSYSRDFGQTWTKGEDIDLRIGGIPLYWPSYAAWGTEGEAVMARSADSYEHEGIEIKDGLVLLTREKKGEGAWKITPIPYPEGTAPDGDIAMVWGRMSSSGENNEYIHIMTPLALAEGATYHGYELPIIYNRTQDGGQTWDFGGGVVFPEHMGQTWPEDGMYSDELMWAEPRGNTIACVFAAMGAQAYAVKSTDNGNTWEQIQFFHTPVTYNIPPEEFADTIFCPSQAHIALDKDGKMHVAFATMTVQNNEAAGTISFFTGLFTSFLSYWNEDMEPFDDAVEFTKAADLYIDGYFDPDQTTVDEFYVIGKPGLPVIGFYTPVNNPPYYIPLGDALDWAIKSYGKAGTFAFPAMGFSEDNVLHIAYLGLLDAGDDGNTHWVRHPFMVSTSDNGATWSETEHLVVGPGAATLIDREFAYLNIAGTGKNGIRLMAQVDAYAGVYTGYVTEGPDQSTPGNNYYYYFSVIDPFVSINELEKITPFTVNVKPNPATNMNTVTVTSVENSDITVYNLLGQQVYHVEKAQASQDIPLNKMVSGVYFVTVRSGNHAITQKLIVK